MQLSRMSSYTSCPTLYVVWADFASGIDLPFFLVESFTLELAKFKGGLLFNRPTERKGPEFVTQSFEKTLNLYSVPNLLYSGGSGGYNGTMRCPDRFLSDLDYTDLHLATVGEQLSITTG
jgi:hypothetical protein